MDKEVITFNAGRNFDQMKAALDLAENGQVIVADFTAPMLNPIFLEFLDWIAPATKAAIVFANPLDNVEEMQEKYRNLFIYEYPVDKEKLYKYLSLMRV